MEPDQREDFERLYRRHRSEIFRYLLRELGNPADADDATQEAFLSALGAIERNGPPAHPRPRLFAIAENLRRRWYRRRRTRPVEPLERAGEVASPEPDVVLSEIADALEQLPVRQAQVLVGRDVAGLSYAELARRLGLTENAVQMLLFRARKRFRAALEAQGRGALAWLPLSRLAALFSDGVAAPALRATAIAGAAAIGFAAAAGGVAGPTPPGVQGHGAPVAAAGTRAPAAHSAAVSFVAARRPPASPTADAPVQAPAADRAQATSVARDGSTTGVARAATTAAGSTAPSQVSSTDVVTTLAAPSVATSLAAVTVSTPTAEAPSSPIETPAVPTVTTTLPAIPVPLLGK